MEISLKPDIKMLKNTVHELRIWLEDMDMYLRKLDALVGEGLDESIYEDYDIKCDKMDSAISHIDNAISKLEELTPIKIS